MLALLDGLDAADGPALWGLTSHLALSLFPALGASERGVTVHGHGPGYVVEPAFAESEWSGGHATDVAGAVRLVLAGLGLDDGFRSRSKAEPGAAADRGLHSE